MNKGQDENSRISRWTRAVQRILTPASVGRRRILIAMAATLVGAVAVRFTSKEVKNASDQELFSALADRLLPAVDNNPGVVMLGIDQQFFNDLKGNSSRTSMLNDIMGILKKAQFTELSEAQQIQFIEDIFSEDKNPHKRQLQFMVDNLVKRYYADSRSWPALDYHPPQPLGYAEYADCAESQSTT